MRSSGCQIHHLHVELWDYKEFLWCKLQRGEQSNKKQWYPRNKALVTTTYTISSSDKILENNNNNAIIFYYVQKSRFSNFFLCTLQSTEVLSHAMPPTFKNKLYAGGKYLQVTSFCKTFFGHRFFLLLHISHQNYVNLIINPFLQAVRNPFLHPEATL